MPGYLVGNNKEITMEQEKNTQTIYFKDLFFGVLYQWKWLVIAAIIGGILLGGAELLTGNISATLNPVTITPEQQLKIDQLEKNLERTNRLIEAQTLYLDESALMTLDPYHTFSSGIYISLTPADPAQDSTYAALRSFYAHLTSATVLDPISMEFDMDVRYFRELVSISLSDDNTLSVSIRGNTQEDAHTMALAFEKAARTFWEAETELNTACNSQFILFDSGAKTDTGLYDTQNSAHQKLTSLKNSAVSIETELKKHAPTQLTTGAAEPLLFAAVGAAAGFCLVAGLACLGYLAGGKLYSAQLLQDRTGLYILGCMNGKKRNAIDAWLRKLEGRTMHDNAEAIAANIANRSKGMGHLLLLGNFDEAACQSLADRLKQLQVSFTLCADPAQSVQTIHALAQCDSAILVETCGKSLYDQVAQCKATIDQYQKPILGCVVIDG